MNFTSIHLVAIFTIWISTALIGQVVPWMLEVLSPGGTFFIFALFCIPILIVLRFILQTKEKSLEEIENFWFKNKNEEYVKI